MKISSVIQEDVQFIVEHLGADLEPLLGKAILITGASGFLCSYFLDVIAMLNDNSGKPPCRVIALDNFKSGVPDRIEHLIKRDDIKVEHHDIRTPYRPDIAVDWIIHGASIASPTFYRQYPLETIDVNVNGTRHMLDLAFQNVRSLLFLSTSEVYGNPDPTFIPTPETYMGKVSFTGPRACYDESKRLAETLCATYFRLYETPVKVVRPFNVYGPGQSLEDLRIIPDLMASAINLEPIVLYSDGSATRSFCYIRDAVQGMIHVMLSEADGEAFNIGNDAEEISIRELAKRMGEVAAPPVLPIEYRLSQDPDYLIDNPQRRRPNLAKISSLVSWRPEVALTEGLSRTLRSYRELSATGAF